jgi:predicted helicase
MALNRIDDLESARFTTSIVKKQDIPKHAPYPHQQEAIAAILNTFQHSDRAHIAMACGSGKSRVALWVAEHMRVKRIVVFVPSLALIKQLLQEWLAITQWRTVSCLAVCSDVGVTRGTDLMDLNPEDCDFPVTTTPMEIQRFLKKSIRSSETKIVFCTYHSSRVLAMGMMGCMPFELGIFDEAHIGRRAHRIWHLVWNFMV